MLRNKIILIGFLFATLVLNAQFFSFSSDERSMPELEGKLRLEPSDCIVGIPAYFVFYFGDKSDVRLQSINGLPDVGVDYLSNELEPYADHTYRLPVRFTKPFTNEVLRVVVSGMQTVVKGKGTAFTSSYSTSFQKKLPDFTITVKELPTEGRPQNFSGAVGTKFTMTQTLAPQKVHPGDLVTATYELKWNGYCPSNVWPQIEHLSKEFKSYEPKEIACTKNSITWQHVLVPRTVAATNSALVSVSYYNPRVGRYEVARAYPKKLEFVSDKAASTENTSVMINETKSGNHVDASGEKSPVLQLRFAPGDNSMVIATLPAATPVKELSRHNNWRRVETPRGIGWIKADLKKQ